MGEFNLNSRGEALEAALRALVCTLQHQNGKGQLLLKETQV